MGVAARAANLHVVDPEAVFDVADHRGHEAERTSGSHGPERHPHLVPHAGRQLRGAQQDGRTGDALHRLRNVGPRRDIDIDRHAVDLAPQQHARLGHAGHIALHAAFEADAERQFGAARFAGGGHAGRHQDAPVAVTADVAAAQAAAIFRGVKEPLPVVESTVAQVVAAHGERRACGRRGIIVRGLEKRAAGRSGPFGDIGRLGPRRCGRRRHGTAGPDTVTARFRSVVAPPDAVVEMLGEEQVFAGSVIQRHKGLHPARRDGARTGNLPGRRAVGAVGDADGEARRVIACGNRHAELRSGGRGPNPATRPGTVEHHPRQVPGIAVPDNLRRRRIERKQARNGPSGAILDANRSDVRIARERNPHDAAQRRERHVGRIARGPDRAVHRACGGLQAAARNRKLRGRQHEGPLRAAVSIGREMNCIKTVRRDIGPHDRHAVGVEAHRASHAVDQCTRLPGPVPTHSGLPGSHLQPQDHPAARRRTGFVPVVRTVPAAAPEEQRKDEQDTYRMTDRKHDATGNAG